jgi:ATP-dependent DNA helicase RecG
MQTYTDTELAILLRDVESDLVERKENLKGDLGKRARQAVCAFANDLPNHRRAGVLLVGVDDAGTPTGLPITDEILRLIADFKADGSMVPPPSIVVEKRRLLGAEIAIAHVFPADAPPVRYDGRIWIRIGPRRGIASRQDENILNEKRRHGDRPFDAQPVRDAKLGDLSRRRFEDDYLPQAFHPDVLAANDRTYEERLAATKMIVSPQDTTPTVAGVLTLGIRPRDFIPGAYVHFLRIAGTKWGDPVTDDAEIDGTLPDIVRRLEDKLIAHNRTAVDFTSSPTEVRTATYPIPALQQLTRNALLHRSYEGTNAPVRVYWFDDRIEIVSPGGPFGMVTAETFGQPGVTDYRNLVLAEAMRVLGLVQRFGFGIPTARDHLAKAGHPNLEFQVEPNWVRCTVKARP